MSERHFKARVPRAKPETVADEIAQQEQPVDILINSHFGSLRATPCTERGRVFLSERYIRPAEYTDQRIEIGPGQPWRMFKVALREGGLRAQYDYSGNHREVE